jgi:hypothetical protein
MEVGRRADSNDKETDMSSDIPRHLLPIPDRPYAGPTMYDARDPDAKYAPIEPVRRTEEQQTGSDLAAGRRGIPECRPQPLRT